MGKVIRKQLWKKRLKPDNLKRAISHPTWAIYNILRIVKEDTLRFFHAYSTKHYFHIKHGHGVDVMERDWDNLIILDACRFDIFEQQNQLIGTLEQIVSGGSTTPQFLDYNFVGKELHDTVYVTANPFAESIDNNVFFEIVKVYRDEDNYHQRLPEYVRKVAADTASKYPNKRLIIHFVQPHSPYIGPKADKLRSEVSRSHDVNFSNLDPSGDDNNDSQETLSHLLNAAKKGYITKEEAREIYTENLRMVLTEVEKLLKNLEGKTVITSDHGDLLGEEIGYVIKRKKYGHFPRYTPVLRFVPWLTIESDSRRKIIPEPPIDDQNVDEDVINEILKDLGYIE